ncbi:MAG: NAD-dependent dehydratase [Candidatus Marinimicrobia bacterium]|nr:NAD-dependent dehydratase [Candidatus Neomarinimicrobiota bacterium]
MKKILITGATGFIGSHLAECCVTEGLDVVAFDRYNPSNSWGWLEESKYKNEMEIILGDIRDFDSVSNALEDCEAVFHLAALIGIPYSYISPLAYIRTNVEGTYNILEASKKQSLQQVLITSTSETYGTAQYTPIDENHPLIGQSPYSASKIAADHLALSYYKSFDLPIKIVRPFNTYGPRQSSRAIIPTIITQIFSGSNELTLGNIDPTRDLTFVKDTCSAFLSIFRSDNFFGEVTNVGMNSEISIRDLAKKIMIFTEKNISIESEKRRIRPENSEVERLVCSNKKLLENSSWKPSYNLEKGLKETVEWFKENPQLNKPKLYHV